MIPKVALFILDGWGLSGAAGNSFAAARKPTFDQLFEQYPAVSLQAAGPAVGLPESCPGGSESGHRALGTGQVVETIIGRLRRDVAAGELWRRPALLEGWQSAKEHDRKVHLVGMLSDSPTHASLELLYSLIDFAAQDGYINKLYLHLFLDGQDAQQRGGQTLLEKLYVYLRDRGYGSIATICGRRYALGRAGQDDQAAAAATLLTALKGTAAKSPLEAIMDHYAHGGFDYDLAPTVCDQAGAIEAGDTVILFNHRGDRQRPLVAALGPRLAECFTVTTVPYANPWPYRTLYEVANLEPNLCSTATSGGKKVTKVTETDRYAHLTYFFNGGKEDPYYHEERVFVETPPTVTAEQGLNRLNAAVLTRLRQAGEDLLIVNVPNLDAAGHTGDAALATAAVEQVDKALAEWLVAAADRWTIIITSDHGNVEYMQDAATGEPRPEDTSSPVPCLIISPDLKGRGGVSYLDLSSRPPVGMLTDVTTTVLGALGLTPPPAMTGVNLLDQR